MGQWEAITRQTVAETITAEGNRVAEQRAAEIARQAEQERRSAAAGEVHAKAQEVVEQFRQFVMAAAPVELQQESSTDPRAERERQEVLRQPAQVTIQLDTYQDRTLGTVNPRATVRLTRYDPAEGIVRSASFADAHEADGADVSVTGQLNDRYASVVDLGGQVFSVEEAMRGVYTSPSAAGSPAAVLAVDPERLAVAEAGIAIMETAAADTLTYLGACARNAALNGDLAARYAL